MSRDRESFVPSAAQAVELFRSRFRERYPEAEISIDGEGYEDEDLDVLIRVDGEQIALEQFAVEVSHAVEAATGFFILAFVRPPADSPDYVSGPNPAGVPN